MVHHFDALHQVGAEEHSKICSVDFSPVVFRSNVFFGGATINDRMRIQHLILQSGAKAVGRGIGSVVQDDVYENELGFIFRGLARSRFRAAEAAVRLALVPTQAVWSMPQNTAGITSIQKGVGRGDVEGGVNNKPFVQG